MRKGGKYVYTLVPTTNSLTPLSPSYDPKPIQIYTREFASLTHLEIQARYLLSKDLSLDVKTNDIYCADDSKRAYTMIVVNSITVTMFRRDVKCGL